MSQSFALDPSPLPREQTVPPKSHAGLGAWFGRVLESLVAAQRRRFEDTDPLLYRFPPL
jgi:hypothetical protein